jgi:hypothetical protein
VTTIQSVDETATGVLHDWMTLTQPLPEREIREAISNVLAKTNREYALDLVTMLQVKARIAGDTGERLSFARFADEVGIDLEQLRASEE